MKAIVVGMGVQGEKRKKYLGKDFIFSVDKFKNADYKSIFNVPLEAYNAAFLCVPESEKIDLIKYCIKNNDNLFFCEFQVYYHKWNYYYHNIFIIKCNTKTIKNLVT